MKKPKANKQLHVSNAKLGHGDMKPMAIPNKVGRIVDYKLDQSKSKNSVPKALA